MASIGVEVPKTNAGACEACPFYRGYLQTPDGNESIKLDSPNWKLISYAYCYLASLFNISDAEQAAKYERKKGPVPGDCPKGQLFELTGVTSK